VSEQVFRWEPWSPEAFERARRERRFILLNGAADWCHWCHVMDETTYGDAAVRRVLGRRFVAIRIDVTARPDLAERYGQGGWPATILFSPDATEIVTYTGYMPPEQMLLLLSRVDSIAGAADVAHARRAVEPAAGQSLARLPSSSSLLGAVFSSE
jgi:uncharacterized protein